MRKLRAWFWEWPDGLVWRVSERSSLRSRREKYRLFLATMRPKENETILDVGATAGDRRGANFLERWYPHQHRITACGVEDLAGFKERFPTVATIKADGRDLPFADREFPVVFSNAVIEHVGSREEQARFVAELCRVGERVFCVTPSKGFPFEPHTLIPFAHWLPIAVRNAIYKTFGRGYWASEERLNPLTENGLKLMFADAGRPCRIVKTKTMGLVSSLIAIVT
jgi:SAM-dependent methyltransferase